MAEWQNLPDEVLNYFDATVAAHGIDALETYVEMIRAERGE